MIDCIFTICAKNYLARARVLMDSLRRHEPSAARIVVLSDRLEGAFDPAGEDFEVLEIEQIAIPDLKGLCFRYDVMELATAVKPSVLLHLLRDRGFGRVAYIDPDTQLLAPLASPAAALDAGAEAALTPHALEPLALGRQFDNAVLQRAGAYNLGFIALRDTPAVRAGLAWWQERLRLHCRRDQPPGEFVDQKWMDLWPLLCPATALLRDPGLNVAYWNLDQRPLRRRAGTWFAGEAPLAFMHFSGFQPGPPLVPSVHRRGLAEADLGEGAQLFHDYARQLRDAGLATTATWPYAFGRFADGRPIPFVLRQFHREMLEPLDGDPFVLPAAFHTDWPAGGRADGTPGELTAFMLFLLRRHSELQRHFPLSGAAATAAYRRWFLAEGASYFGLPRWLLDATAERLAAPPSLAAAS